jgi:hypothetical protein
MFDDFDLIQMYEERKQRLIAICEGATKFANQENEKLREIERRLLEMSRPKNFMGNQSEEIKFEKNFQVLCHSLNSHTNKDVKKMSVLEVYSLIEMLKKQERNVKSD